MLTVIRLEEMEFRAFHGCYDLEKVVGNRFIVALEIEAEVGDAASCDDLNGAVNYLTAFEIVRQQMEQTSNIIENVALRIINTIKEQFPNAIRVTCTVSKMAPPLGGKIGRVSATLTK